MELTKRQQYGLRGLVYLASRPPGEPIPVREICEVMGLPESYLVKILQDLSRRGLVFSHRGMRGGFSLARPAKDISIREALEACVGALFPVKCLLGNPICSDEAACPIHRAWFHAQDEFLMALERISLADIAGRVSESQGCRSRF